MLFNGGNLGVDSFDTRAGYTGKPDRSSVALQSTVNQGGHHALDVVARFSIGEGAIGSGLLEAIRVLGKKQTC